MQIYALDSQRCLTHAHSAKRQQSYWCPECQGLVRIRGGRFRQLHFYHYQSAVCRQSSKSLIHLNIQYALQKMLAPETILLEHRFPEIGRIADVVWPAKKLIFEVQVSPISPQEVHLRNQDYKRMGYTVIWILHDRRYNRSQVSRAEAFLRCSPHYFTNINTFGKGIFYDQYAFIQFRRRIQQSDLFPVRFRRMTYFDLKQLPRHFPSERKKWRISFEGDLYHRRYDCKQAQEKCFSILRFLLHLYEIFFHFLLEKTTD